MKIFQCKSVSHMYYISLNQLMMLFMKTVNKQLLFMNSYKIDMYNNNINLCRNSKQVLVTLLLHALLMISMFIIIHISNISIAMILFKTLFYIHLLTHLYITHSALYITELLDLVYCMYKQTKK